MLVTLILYSKPVPIVSKSHAITPKGSNFTTRQNPAFNQSKGGRNMSSYESRKLNKSMVSENEGLHDVNTISMRQYLKRKIKLNPLAEVEADISKAKTVLQKVQNTRSKSEQASGEQQKLVLLNKENILLRNELKEMNNNLNKFIDIIKEIKTRRTEKTKRYNRSVCMSKEDKLKFKGAEKQNYSHMTENMKKEHSRVRVL